MNDQNEKQIALEAVLNDILPKHRISGSELAETIHEVSKAADRAHITDEYKTNDFLEKPRRKKLNTVLEAAGSSALATAGVLAAVWAILHALI
ncbi:hypothetical protein ABLN87_11980 [Ruegeria sp. SCPT10]|uniref:hypothetical protein n=1 Tax=Ruegeria sp. SCP10 TaxID=3141377 RepID=UPI00333D74F5